jgi:hypothetical protein
VSVIGCLFAHNRERNPRLKGATRTVVVNNLIYNWGAQCIGVGTKGNDVYLTAARSAVVGNVAVEGGDTASSVFVENLDTGADVYLLDNLARRRSGADIELSNRGVSLLTRPPLWPAALRYAPVRDAARAPAHGRRPTRAARSDRQPHRGLGHPRHGRPDQQPEQRRRLSCARRATSRAHGPEGGDPRRRWLDALPRAGRGARARHDAFEAVLR